MAMSVPGPGVAGVHGELVAQGAQEDAALGEVMDQVEGLANVAAQPVQGEQADPVAGPGEAEQGGQAVAVHVRAGSLVDVDVLLGDAGGAHRVDLPSSEPLPQIPRGRGFSLSGAIC
jgi:hypothetical protein